MSSNRIRIATIRFIFLYRDLRQPVIKGHEKITPYIHVEAWRRPLIICNVFGHWRLALLTAQIWEMYIVEKRLQPSRRINQSCLKLHAHLTSFKLKFKANHLFRLRIGTHCRSDKLICPFWLLNRTIFNIKT